MEIISSLPGRPPMLSQEINGVLPILGGHMILEQGTDRTIFIRSRT
jgi:hypothetical protein